MVRLITISLIFIFLAAASKAQEIYFGSSASLYVGSKANFFSGGDLTLAGLLENQGTLYLYGDSNFDRNVAVGDLTFNGVNNQTLTGNTLYARGIAVDKSGQLDLEVTQLIGNSLQLNSGVVNSDQAESFMILNGHDVKGGSISSYVTGNLQLQSLSSDPLRFPLGFDGMYNELILETTQENSIITALAHKPTLPLTPGDSLVGISNDIEWIVSQSGGDFNTTLSASLDGIDITNIPITNEIRAEGYRPVLAYRDDDSNTFKPLGFVDQTDSNVRSSNSLATSRVITLNGKPIHISVGLVPEGGPYFYIPNAFAPDGQYEENRIFRPFLDGAEIYVFKMRVWDQFNKEMFTTSLKNPRLRDIGWDGTFNGNKAPEALYYYSISLETAIGDFDEKGTVVLLR